MGCCEGRDADHLSLPRSSRSNGHSNRLQDAAKESDQGKAWLQFAEARNKGDISALVEFLHSSEKAKCRYPQKDEWVPPTSIGGHAVSALADMCQERGDEVAKALENDLHRIVEYIDSRSLELQDPSLVLLYHVSPSLSPSLKDRVINIGGFNGLLKVMRSGSKLKRQTAAETCRILYEGSDTRKDKFVSLDGITTLVHVMNMDRDDVDYVHNSLLRLYELTQQVEMVLLALLVAVCAAFVVPETTSTTERFRIYKWLEPKNGDWEVVQMKEEDRLAIVLRKDVQLGDPVVWILANHVISSFESFDWHPYIKDSIPEMILVMRLIYEKFVSPPGSFVSEFVRALPVKLLGSMNWTESENLRFINHSYLRITKEMRKPYDDGFASVSKALAKVPGLQSVCPHCYSLEAFTWAFMTMMTVGFSQSYAYWLVGKGYPFQEEDFKVAGVAIYPLFDLVRQHPLPRRHRLPNRIPPTNYDQTLSAYGMFADRPYHKGSVLSYDLRDLTNLQLLYVYGYVIERNLYHNTMLILPHKPHCYADFETSEECNYFLFPLDVHKGLLHRVREEALGDETCVTEVSGDFLRYFHSLPLGDKEQESKHTFADALLRYRQSLESLKTMLYGHWSLRHERRDKPLATSEKTKLAFDLGISDKVTFYEHLKQVERLHLKVLWELVF